MMPCAWLAGGFGPFTFIGGFLIAGAAFFLLAMFWVAFQ